MSSNLTSIFQPARQRQKILVSPGYGAGWVTWAEPQSEYSLLRTENDAFVAWMITYQPLIDLIEENARFTQSVDWTSMRYADECDDYLETRRWTFFMTLERMRTLEEFDREAKERFGVENVCHAGAKTLRVAEVAGPFMLMEYDGDESIIRLADRDTIKLE